MKFNITAVIGAAAFALGLLAAGLGQQWRWGAKLETQARLHTDTLAEIQRAGQAAQRREDDRYMATQQELADKNRKLQGELADARKQNQEYSARLATGAERVYVKVSNCAPAGNPVQTPTPSGSVVHGTSYAELHPATAYDLEVLAGDANEVANKLLGCQEHVRTIEARWKSQAAQ